MVLRDDDTRDWHEVRELGEVANGACADPSQARHERRALALLPCSMPVAGRRFAVDDEGVRVRGRS